MPGLEASIRGAVGSEILDHRVTPRGPTELS